MRRVLFTMSIYHYARELGPVADHFAGNGYEVHVLVGWRGPTAETFVSSWNERGYVVHRVPPGLAYGDSWDPREGVEDVPAGATPGRIRSLRSAAGLRVYALAMFAKELRSMRAAKLFADRLIADVDPDVVIGSSYRSCGTFDNGVGRATRERSILYCCVPQSPYLGERNAVDGRLTQMETGMMPPTLAIEASSGNRLLARLFPGWTREAHGKRIFSWAPTRMLAARLTGLLEDNPWQQPSERYGICFVDSEFASRTLRESGYGPEKIVPVGRPILDRVFRLLGDREHERQLHEELRLEPGSPFLLFNVEPTYEHHYASAEEHWAQFHELMQTLRRTELDVVLSLHPLCNPRDYRFVEDEYGFRLCERYAIGDLYPYCGVSVSFPCSTNLMAELFERPLVIYDWVGMTREDHTRSDLFRHPGATYAYDSDELYERISAVAPKPPFGATRESRVPASERIRLEVESRLERATP